MTVLAIEPLRGPLAATIHVPGSKSMTNRALVIAALGRGESTVTNALASEDTEHMVESLRRLGFTIGWKRETETIRVAGEGGRIPARSAELYGGNAGTVVRFLVSMAALGEGTFRIDGSPRMRERPLADLLEALGALGVHARSETGTGCPPVVVDAHGIRGGRTEVAGGVSSQFTSSILLASPYAHEDVEIAIRGTLVGEPFVDMTVGMMERAGAGVERMEGSFRVTAGQVYEPGEIRVESDATAASYFLAAAALVGGRVTVPGLARTSLQGDVAFVGVLERMGARVFWTDDGVTVEGGELRGLDVDMAGFSDTFLTLAAVAPFASSPTTLLGIGHTRHQETDRVAAVARELTRLGVRVEERSDALVIHPGQPQGAEVETYDDHRMAMAFALVGLVVPGVRILDPECVRKTFPAYFEMLGQLRDGERR